MGTAAEERIAEGGRRLKIYPFLKRLLLMRYEYLALLHLRRSLADWKLFWTGTMTQRRCRGVACLPFPTSLPVIKALGHGMHKAC